MIHVGDSMDLLPTLAENSVDSIVTDPPYHLTSLSRGGHARNNNPESPHGRHRIGDKGFMGKVWDGGDIAHRPEFWAECLRVAKPGAYLVAFGGTRTFHRLACAIEDAGWELRDTIGFPHDELTLEPMADCPWLLAWVYGSGFPKSLDVSKAIDKAADYRLQAAFRRAYVEAVQEAGLKLPGNTRHDWTVAEHAPGDRWWSTFKEWLPSLSDSQRARIDRIVTGKGFKPRPTFYTGGIGGDATAAEYDITSGATDESVQWEGWGTALKPAWEPIVLARKPLRSTVAANVLAHGTGAINIDACRVAVEGERAAVTGKGGVPARNEAGEPKPDGFVSQPHPGGRWPANLVHDGSSAVVDRFPSDAGAQAPVFTRNSYGDFGGNIDEAGSTFQGDSGSAARFFYCPKAAREERNAGCENMVAKPLNWSSGAQSPGTFQSPGTDRSSENFHPTVKPTELMRWLCRLVTPPGGMVLDPFAGSGSTGRAAVSEGFLFTGIELDPEYAAIAEARIRVTQQGFSFA